VTAFARQQPVHNDAILYVGANEKSAATELTALRNTGARVHDAAPSSTPDEISIGTRTFDLSVESGRSGFVKALGLPADTADNVERVLARAGRGYRDELAAIAKVFAPAERGTGPSPSRIVLSGHSLGGQVFGGQDRSLVFSDLYALAKAMPKAAQGIEDLHLSGCSTDAELSDAQQAIVRNVFPNLRSSWGYNGEAPTAPVDHLRAWERSTRGSSVPTEAMVRALPHVAIVTNAERIEAPLSQTEVAQRVRTADARFDGYMSGEVPIRAAHGGDAETTHRAYQRAAAREQDPVAQIALRDRATSMGLLRYYEHGVRREFQREHGRTIASGYRSLGLPAPDFARLSRKEALGAARAFESALNSVRNPDPAALETSTLLVALSKLDPARIRPEWCTE